MQFISSLATILLTGLVTLSAPSFCLAADYPSRPIRFIVPFAPGGSTDLVARIVGGMLAATFKQQVVVENKPGGGTVIAMQATATAAPDGYTLLFGSSALANYPSLFKKLVLRIGNLNPFFAAKNSIPSPAGSQTHESLVKIPRSR